nr:hypothetical protein CFP56_21357 [Quercus suber]
MKYSAGISSKSSAREKLYTALQCWHEVPMYEAVRLARIRLPDGSCQLLGHVLWLASTPNSETGSRTARAKRISKQLQNH